MKKLILISSVFVMSVLASQSALAGTVKVRVGPSKQNFITDMKLNTQTTEYVSDYMADTLGLTYITESGFYIDGQTTPFTTSGLKDGEQRVDQSVVLGRAWTTDAGLTPSVYLGYTNGTSRLGPANRRDYIVEIAYVLGGGLGIPLDMGGSLGLAIGLGSVSVDLQEKYGTYAIGKSSGNNGYSYGLSYNYPINETFGVIADYKAQNYSFTITGTANGEISAKMSRYGLSLYAQF